MPVINQKLRQSECMDGIRIFEGIGSTLIAKALRGGVGIAFALVISVMSFTIAQTQFSEAQDLKKLRICVKACEIKRNICYRVGAKASCRQKYQACVLRCRKK